MAFDDGRGVLPRLAELSVVHLGLGAIEATHWQEVPKSGRIET